MSEWDERVYYECDECCTGWSGPYGSASLDRKIDAHEAETGHRVSEVKDNADV
jgi:hypothetical protein